MNCGIYARVSTRDKGQDFTNQLIALRDFVAKQGWSIYREYVDQVTGSTDDRSQFQQMFEDASQRTFDVLLFWSLDRLSRERVLETLQHLQRLTGYGVAWRSFTEQYLDSTGIFREAAIAFSRPLLSRRGFAWLNRRGQDSNGYDAKEKIWADRLFRSLYLRFGRCRSGHVLD